jgi:hypothetical protein
MRLLGGLKKRRNCDDKEEEPKLEDLREAIAKTTSSKPFSKFLNKWEKLGTGWPRRLVCHDLQTPLELLPKEKGFIFQLAGLLVCNEKWAEEVGFAFGCPASTIRNIFKSEVDSLFDRQPSIDKKLPSPEMGSLPHDQLEEKRLRNNGTTPYKCRATDEGIEVEPFNGEFMLAPPSSSSTVPVLDYGEHDTVPEVTGARSDEESSGTPTNESPDIPYDSSQQSTGIIKGLFHCVSRSVRKIVRVSRRIICVQRPQRQTESEIDYQSTSAEELKFQSIKYIEDVLNLQENMKDMDSMALEAMALVVTLLWGGFFLSVDDCIVIREVTDLLCE